MSEIMSERPRVVVGVDGSAQSAAALRWAGRIAGFEHATVDVVGAWEYPTSYGWAALPDDYEPEKDLTEIVTQVVDGVFGADRPPYVQVAIREGHPVRVLLDAAAGARMVVVGSRGHGGFAGLLLGSVSSRVAELATCPVLVVHGNTVDP